MHQDPFIAATGLAASLFRLLGAQVHVCATPDDLLAIGLPVLPDGWVLQETVADDPAWTAGTRQLVLVRSLNGDAAGLKRVLARLRADGSLRTVVLVLHAADGVVAQRGKAIEALAYAAGWRRHPGAWLCRDYEAQAVRHAPVVMPLEKLPESSEIREAEGGTSDRQPWDMLRAGDTSAEARHMRYHLAAEQIRPGDRVLDAICGAGDGSHVLAQLSRCSEVVGVDSDEQAIAYARRHYGGDARLRFRQVRRLDRLSELPDASFDVVVSYEVLRNETEASRVIAEFARLLKPGGRLVVGVGGIATHHAAEASGGQALTLDALRRLYARHFVRDRLYRQVDGEWRGADGKLLPRSLRELPVDTAAPPPGQWWILTGHRPLVEQASDRISPDMEGWASACGPHLAGDRLANGLVLAMHCVPAEVDPSVEAFWSALAAALARRGHGLVLLSTTTVRDPALQSIEMPFELTAFAKRYPVCPSGAWSPDEASVGDVARWYRCSPGVASGNLRLARELFSDLLATLRPAAVLGWQALNPVTRMLRDSAVHADIPYWNAERGWVRNTLQIDMGGIHQLGEARLSLANHRLRRSYRPSEAVLETLSRRALGASDLGRYAGTPRRDAQALRSGLGIPPEAKVAVVFTHGEPGINTMGHPLVREVHDISAELMQHRFDQVSAALLTRGYWVLVQEHPFNHAAGRLLHLPPTPRVQRVAESVSSLLDLADVCLFTLATLQFDAVFLGRPMGLLSKSGLYRQGVPPFVGDYVSADAFVDDLLDRSVWPARAEQLQAEVAFLFEHTLLDLEQGALERSAEECAAWLSQIARPVDGGLDVRIDAFLQKWNP